MVTLPRGAVYVSGMDHQIPSWLLCAHTQDYNTSLVTPKLRSPSAMLIPSHMWATTTDLLGNIQMAEVVIPPMRNVQRCGQAL